VDAQKAYAQKEDAQSRHLYNHGILWR